MSLVEGTFWFFACWAAGSAMICITRRSPIASALWLVSTMCALAAIYVLLQAHFIAAIQIIVYTGAIMVLFLFVIMLLNLDDESRPSWRQPGWLLALAVTALLGLSFSGVPRYTAERLAREFSVMPDSLAIPSRLFLTPDVTEAVLVERGVVGSIAEPLFRGYLVPFEVTSVLLLAAVVGAVVLAKKRL